MNQIKSLHQSISSDINLSKNEGSIFHTDQNKLKNEFIDQDKAITILKNLKKQDKYESNHDLQIEDQDQFESSILFKDKIGQNKKFANIKKKQEWDSFIDYLKVKPETLLNLMPNSKNATIEFSQSQIKRPVSRFQTLGREYIQAGQSLQRPYSCHQNTQASGLHQTSSTKRNVSTAAHGARYKPMVSGTGDLSSTLDIPKTFGNNRGKTNSTGRVMRSSHFIRTKSSLGKSRPSQYSTQYSYFLNNDENMKHNNKSSVFSNQYTSNQQPSFRQNVNSSDKLIKIHQEDESPINQESEANLRPKTSLSNN